MWNALFNWPRNPAEQATKISFFDFISATLFLFLLARWDESARDLLSRHPFPADFTLGKTFAMPLLLGFLIWEHWPSQALWLVGVFVGVNLLMNGMTRLMLTLAVRRALNPV